MAGTGFIVSNTLAVAAVTATLQRQLDNALIAAASEYTNGVQGAKVFVGHPATTHSGATAGADLLLYRVTPDPNLRNADLATRDAAGNLIAAPVAAVALRYLIACFGDEANQEPEQVLGTIAAYLHAFPTLTPAMIDAARASGQFPFLNDADLASQLRPVRMTQVPVDDEDLFRIWSMLESDQLVPTLVLDATVVLLEQPATTSAPYPVLSVGQVVAPIDDPVVSAVVRQGQPSTAPIRAGDAVDVRGRNLTSTNWMLSVDGITVPTPAITSATESLVTFTLPTTTAAGARSLQVAHVLGGGPPPATVFTATSEPRTFAVHPVVDALAKSGNDVVVTVHTAIAAGQRVDVLVNEVGTAHSAALPGRVTAPTTVRADVSGLAAGTYVVRVRVDGVASIPTVSGSGIIDGPQVAL
jgi:hypothetical protein